MRYIGYYVNGKNFGCNRTAERKAKEYSEKTGYPVYLKAYKV